tara:strand:+ start:215 stop:667 length:453 start_codon:yes stop_codon:yes gene_type:complete
MPFKDPDDRAEYNENYYNTYKDLINKKNAKRVAAMPRKDVPCRCGGRYTQVGKLKGAQKNHEGSKQHLNYEYINKFIVPNFIRLQPDLTRGDLLKHMDKKYISAVATSHARKMVVIKTTARWLRDEAKARGAPLFNRELVADWLDADKYK